MRRTWSPCRGVAVSRVPRLRSTQKACLQSTAVNSELGTPGKFAFGVRQFQRSPGELVSWQAISHSSQSSSRGGSPCSESPILAPSRSACPPLFSTIVHRPTSIVHRASCIVHRPSSIVHGPANRRAGKVHQRVTWRSCRKAGSWGADPCRVTRRVRERCWKPTMGEEGCEIGAPAGADACTKPGADD